MTDMTFAPPGPRRGSGGKLAAVIAAGVIGFFALGMFAAGGALLWGHSERDAQGYLSTDSERFTTDTYALATENLDLDLDGLDAIVSGDSYGKVRVRVDSDAEKPAFVGIARTSAVTDYLRGSAHALVEDVDSSPFDADYRTLAGDRRPETPAEQRFWAASAQGKGTQDLVWDVREGDWSVVVMNADGSPGVDAGVSAGARIAWLDEAGWIVVGGGLVFLVLAAGLLYAGVRPPGPAAPVVRAPVEAVA